MALASAGCSGSDPAADSPTPTTDQRLLVDASADSSSSTSTTVPAPPERVDDDSLDDGRHAGYVRSVDADARTLVVDVIQFLTGDAARTASTADGHGAEVPNDYYIRNVNPMLRTLPFAEAAEVTVLDSSVGGSDAARSVPADIATLARVVGLRVDPGDGNPFWITVADGRVVKVEEQYLP